MPQFSLYYKTIILLLLFSLCNAIIVRKTVKVRPFLREFQRFGFARGGQVNFKGWTDPPSEAPNTHIYICNNGDFNRLINQADSEANGICGDPSSSHACEVAANISDPKLADYRITAKDFYHFLIIHCDGKEVSARLEYTLLNPGGQQLSIGYEPLPTLYMVLTILWGSLFCAWVFLYLFYRNNRVPLHTLIVAVSLMKLFVVVVALCYWRICEQTGRCLDYLKYLQSFLFAVSETSFFCALLLIAKGWRITRVRLPASEIRTISVALILLLSTLLFFSFYNDGYYFLSLMIMYFFMLPKIFTSITRNTRALETQLLFINHANADFEITAINQKIKLFKTLRTSVVIYLGSILLVNSMRIIMIWYLDWFNYVMNEVVVLLMMTLISYILLPHNRALFSATPVDANLFPLFNMDDLYGDTDLVMFSFQETSAPDISEIVVVEYPYDKNSIKMDIFDDEPNNETPPNAIPLAIGILEKSKDESKSSIVVDKPQ